MVDLAVRRFRLRALVLSLAFLAACSCGKSSADHGSSGDPDAGASGDAGEAGRAGSAGSGGSSQGGTPGTGGSAAVGGTSSSGAAGADDGGLGGTGGTSDPGGSGGTGDGGRAGASGNGGRGGESGSGASSGVGGRGGSAGAAGAGGAEATYATCQFGSGIARTVVAKRDTARDRCVVLVMNQPGSDTLGLTLPMGWGVENAFFSTPAAADCLVPFPSSSASPADSGTGTVTRMTGFVIDVDVTLNFPGNVMEHLEATGLDASRACTF